MRKKSNQHGQALIELIIFLPLMFMIYSIVAGFANAINGSINQQKITRSYFYYRIQNNPMIPKPDRQKTHLGWGSFGMFYIGWKDYFEGGEESGRPIAACYRVSVPLKASTNDKCEEKYTSNSTQFIRVQTVYGICGATYQTIGNYAVPVPDYPSMEFNRVTSLGSCLITQ